MTSAASCRSLGSRCVGQYVLYTKGVSQCLNSGNTSNPSSALNSFSEAAEGNYISQSAISQQIQALERELGFELFERRNRSFTPTPAGEYFYRKSLVLTADYDAHVPRCLQDRQRQSAQSCAVGYLRCYSGSEFHRALDEFSAGYPDVSLAVEYGNHEELYAMLRTG